MKCPNCGAETTSKICEFCNSEMPKEESQTIINITNNYYPSEQTSKSTTPERKKSPIWLWVLGWICIFPLPLTILLFRKKEMKPALKYGIIAIAWIIYIIIGLSGKSENSNDNTTVTGNNSTVVEETANTDNATNTVVDNQEEITTTPVFFETDEVVNQFIIDYQAVAGYKMTEISKGNIRQKCFCYAGNCYMEILDSLDSAAENVNLSINFGDCTQEEIMEVTTNCLKVFGATDEEIQKTIDDFTVNNDGDYMIEGYNTNSSITCTYVPTKELSKGKSTGRIEIASSTYGK